MIYWKVILSLRLKTGIGLTKGQTRLPAGFRWATGPMENLNSEAQQQSPRQPQSLRGRPAMHRKLDEGCHTAVSPRFRTLSVDASISHSLAMDFL